MVIWSHPQDACGFRHDDRRWLPWRQWNPCDALPATRLIWVDKVTQSSLSHRTSLRFTDFPHSLSSRMGMEGWNKRTRLRFAACNNKLYTTGAARLAGQAVFTDAHCQCNRGVLVEIVSAQGPILPEISCFVLGSGVFWSAPWLKQIHPRPNWT